MGSDGFQLIAIAGVQPSFITVDGIAFLAGSYAFRTSATDLILRNCLFQSCALERSSSSEIDARSTTAGSPTAD